MSGVKLSEVEVRFGVEKKNKGDSDHFPTRPRVGEGETRQDPRQPNIAPSGPENYIHVKK